MKLFKNIKEKYFKWIEWAVAGIIFGGFSTPVWNHILKPIITSSIDFVMNFLINISKSIESIIYQNIAHYNTLTNTAEIKYIMLIIVLTVCMCTIPVRNSFKRFKKIERSTDNADDLKKEIEKSEKVISICDRLIIISAIFMIGLSASDIYSAQMHHDFNYKLNVCAPYMNPHEYLMLKSSFLLIKNKNDYNSIMNTLNKILDNNHITL